ncbi:hypothetical protein BJ508DRAFT_373003 [Ascobolus immersus RN42]|uniref:Uncharacterized protein n=1 Tax=Ascobolus immersus RN42 TaxID=1160509 RepID=A0A3N4IK68_ASCIM|nr:hypothetical protein BJ508DRAFT_373003 [Ascobolus immersus RN42]
MPDITEPPQWLSNDPTVYRAPTTYTDKPAPPPTTAPLTRADVLSLLEADQDLWPQPLTEEQIISWWDSAPDWSWKYITSSTATSTTTGLFFCIPLRKSSFRMLQRGKLKEHQIGEEHIWKPAEDGEREVGLHVFHVEKDQTKAGWRREWGGMMARAFADLQLVVKKHGVEVLGYSALAVTPDGFRAFKNAGFELFDIERSAEHTPVEGVEPDAPSLLALPKSKDNLESATFAPSNGYWFFKEAQENQDSMVVF